MLPNKFARVMVAAIVTFVVIATPLQVGTVKADAYSCSLELYIQDKNHVILNVGVNGGSGYPGRLEWGDGSYTDLPSGQGQHVYHAYPYNVGWFTYYTVSLYVSGVETCRMAIGISDYRGPSFCNLYLVELGHNELTVGADVNGAGDYPGRLEWGDGTYVDIGQGPGSHVHHAYSYTVGGITTYTMTLAVPGAEACVGTYTIDDAGGQSWMSNTTPHTGQAVSWEFPGSEPVAHYGPAPSGQQLLNNNWGIGNQVGLCIGTQIRTGSGVGYTVHTVVPENNWPVNVINGPRYADGYTWWDISRWDGGTGWVRQDQADCNEREPSSPPPPPPSGLPTYAGWSSPPWSNSYVQITVFNLRLRAAPNMDATINGYVAHGQYYKLLETQGAWGKVEGQSTQGWIYLPGYTVVTNPSPTPPNPPQMCEVSAKAHYRHDQGGFIIEIPKAVHEPYEIFYNGNSVPNNDQGIRHDGFAGETDTTFFLGISTTYAIEHLIVGILIDSNWKVRYPC